MNTSSSNHTGPPAAPTVASEIETWLLLEAVYLRYGYDFRQYARTSIDRRLDLFCRLEGIATRSILQSLLLCDPACMERLLATLTVETTSMFRDPEFYVALRHTVLPLLRGLPLLRIWHAGCSSGEEVYSLAILLREERFDGALRVYATDISATALERAKNGIYGLGAMRENSDRYVRAGGTCTFADYYVADYGSAIMDASLKKNITWAHHNLVTDRSFNEFHLILCRNVLIYFNPPLQNRVHTLFYESLAPGGVLALGDKETVAFTGYEARYQTLDPRAKLYRKPVEVRHTSISEEG